MIQVPFVYNATVLDVYDGDTMTVQIDVGFGVALLKQKVRLHGINTPEVKGAHRTAGLEVRDQVRAICPVGSAFVLESIKGRKGKWGRWLARIHLADGSCLNDLLISQGYAHDYDAR